ncbi:hypothetical protein, partial [Aeromonas caviae]|uniref:hypothetical protein n=1 Tax=Aeromonas caviae TaxID=648 RepID=UPI0019D4B0CF
LKGKQGVMVGRKRLGDDGITWPEGGNINMMHGDSRVMVVVCLETASLPAPCLSTSTFPGSREEPKKCPTSMAQVGRDLMFNCSGIDIECRLAAKFPPSSLFFD